MRCLCFYSIACRLISPSLMRFDHHQSASPEGGPKKFDVLTNINHEKSWGSQKSSRFDLDVLRIIRIFLSWKYFVGFDHPPVTASTRTNNFCTGILYYDSVKIGCRSLLRFRCRSLLTLQVVVRRTSPLMKVTVN